MHTISMLVWKFLLWNYITGLRKLDLYRYAATQLNNTDVALAFVVGLCYVIIYSHAHSFVYSSAYNLASPFFDWQHLEKRNKQH